VLLRTGQNMPEKAHSPIETVIFEWRPHQDPQDPTCPHRTYKAGEQLKHILPFPYEKDHNTRTPRDRTCPSLLYRMLYFFSGLEPADISG